jgi:hypothetical protein
MFMLSPMPHYPKATHPLLLEPEVELGLPRILLDLLPAIVPPERPLDDLGTVGLHHELPCDWFLCQNHTTQPMSQGVVPEAPKTPFPPPRDAEDWRSACGILANCFLRIQSDRVLHSTPVRPAVSRQPRGPTVEDLPADFRDLGGPQVPVQHL